MQRCWALANRLAPLSADQLIPHITPRFRDVLSSALAEMPFDPERRLVHICLLLLFLPPFPFFLPRSSSSPPTLRPFRSFLRPAACCPFSPALW